MSPFAPAEKGVKYRNRCYQYFYCFLYKKYAFFKLLISLFYLKCKNEKKCKNREKKNRTEYEQLAPSVCNKMLESNYTLLIHSNYLSFCLFVYLNKKPGVSFLLFFIIFIVVRRITRTH